MLYLYECRLLLNSVQVMAQGWAFVNVTYTDSMAGQALMGMSPDISWAGRAGCFAHMGLEQADICFHATEATSPGRHVSNWFQVLHTIISCMYMIEKNCYFLQGKINHMTDAHICPSTLGLKTRMKTHMDMKINVNMT